MAPAAKKKAPTCRHDLSCTRGHHALTNRTTSAPVPAIKRAQAQASMTIATTAATRLVVVLGSVASGLFAEVAKRETKMGWPFSLTSPPSAACTTARRSLCDGTYGQVDRITHKTTLGVRTKRRCPATCSQVATRATSGPVAPHAARFRRAFLPPRGQLVKCAFQRGPSYSSALPTTRERGTGEPGSSSATLPPNWTGRGSTGIRRPFGVVVQSTGWPQ